METLQDKIRQDMQVKAEINPEEEIRLSIDFIKAYFKDHHFLKTAVLGISGGQDSTLAGRLTQLAIEELRSETGDDSYQFYALRLPYGKQSDAEDVADAMAFIQADHDLTINIKSAVDATITSLQEAGIAISDYHKGNIKARQRMIVQYAVAGQKQGVVIGTDHPAENVTGFFTKFGDGGADILPLFRLNKRQGRQLLEKLGAPDHLIYKEPTADLEEEKPMQADEEALGVSYEAIDDYLEGKKISPKDQEVIESHYIKSQHKRQMPIKPFDIM